MISQGVQKAATGDVTTGATILYGFATALTTAGTLTMRDGGAGGDVKITINVQTGNANFLIPFGIHFPNGLHVTFTTAVGAVTFWV